MIYFLTGIFLTQLLYVKGAFRQPRNVPFMIYNGYILVQLLFVLVLFSFPSIGNQIWINLLVITPFTVHLFFMLSYLEEQQFFSYRQSGLIKKAGVMLLLPALIFCLIDGITGSFPGKIYTFLAAASLVAWICILINTWRTSDPTNRPVIAGGMLLAAASVVILHFKADWSSHIIYVLLVLVELFLFHLSSAKNRVKDELELAATQQQVIEQLKKNEELEYSRFSIRNKIARDLHDELGATLSGVVLFSELSKRSIERNEAVPLAPYLNRISEACGTMSEKINDIVWASHEGYDKLYKIIDRLQDYIKPICAGKNIQLDFHAEEAVLELDMEVEKSNQLYMISKEALNNAVKYGAPGNIRYLAVKTSKGCKITIEDNGVGFDITTVKSGNGIRYMNQRCGELKAIFRLESQPGRGTFIQLEF